MLNSYLQNYNNPIFSQESLIEDKQYSAEKKYKKKKRFKTATIYLLLYTYIQQLFHHNDKKADLKQQPYIQHIKTEHIYKADKKKKKKTLDTHNDTI